MPIQLPPSAGGGTYPDWQACLVSCPPYEKFLATALKHQREGNAIHFVALHCEPALTWIMFLILVIIFMIDSHYL